MNDYDDAMCITALREEIKRLCREGNAGMWEQENRELRVKIEELKRELLHELNANETKGQRIEELEKDIEHRKVLMGEQGWTEHPIDNAILDGHIITTEQIDAAWVEALKVPYIHYPGECKGSGVHRAWDFYPDEDPHSGQTCSACLDCNGKGWVKE
jgi:hypothetical protein